MRRKTMPTLLTALAVLFVALSVSIATTSAQSGGGYDLGWSTIDGGGGESTGGGFALSGSTGQPDAGVLWGGGYTLNGGFWPGAAASYRVFLPLVTRS
jgi:hypothetical protein